LRWSRSRHPAPRSREDDGGRKCSDATLRGLYVFSASGYNVIGGVAQPKAINETIRFDDPGTFVSPTSTVSINGNVLRSTNSQGAYSVNADCSGTMSFVNGPSFDILVMPSGAAVFMIQTAPGTPVLQGVAERVSR
jgi:hypothetical protein